MSGITFRLAVSVSLLLSMGCRERGLTQGEGYGPVPGERVWYRIVGTGPRTPLLVLHGGPGIPSYYLKPLAALADERPVIFYDQLGAGHSDHPTDTTLWRIQWFVEELGRVRQALGLEVFDSSGHLPMHDEPDRYVRGHPRLSEEGRGGVTAVYFGMRCQRCGEREAEIFQTQHVGDKTYSRDLCAGCAKLDYGVFLGALLQSQAPGARSLTADEERELRRVLDEAAPPDDEG